MAPPRGKVAFITGANGITGNAIVEHLIRKPESEWSKIIITSRRTPTHSFWQDHRVRFIALDFLKPVEELIEKMAPLCHDVTHAFFASYVHTADFTKLRDANVPLFHNFLVATDIVAASTLQRVCVATGGKYYGAHLGPTEVPLHEGMGRYEDHGENFYYPQEDFLFSLAAKRSWDWNVIRPDAIIGFTPSGNGMSMALTLAIYMLCCREMGQAPMFPGNKFFYNKCIDDCSYAPSIADMSVWAVTNEHAKNEAFNHMNGDVFVWKHLWTKLGRHFGIAVPEFDDSEWTAKGEDQVMANNFSMIEWAKDKKPVWERVVAKHGGTVEAFDWGTWDFFDWAVGKAWCTISSVSKARKFGWTRFDDTYDTYIETFHAFENAGVLPHSDVWLAPKIYGQSSLSPHPGQAVAQAAIRKLKQNGATQNGTENHGHGTEAAKWALKDNDTRATTTTAGAHQLVVNTGLSEGADGGHENMSPPLKGP
ncbi:NAD-dependent epimerase dehydratase [Fusarium albosuccineum]|uniref:NAD-dependent epimerase dehydratase n=1 Tax=Fusarium albosuccineum TaxID=1237068 RepID=A0A8H4KW92_9HYPO|nr:NAD-dependent epimerase dehydratase [Fusarium albosuccineum]